MGRLSLIFVIGVIFFSGNSFATTEKDNQENSESLRLQTLLKEKEKEEKSLHILKEELTFCFASAECNSERTTELKENILASEENLKFLTAEIKNARGEKPQVARGTQNDGTVPKKGNRMWWDVYSREKTVQ